MGSPARMPNNPLTRMMENLASENANRRASGGGVVYTGEPLPSARSAAVGREVVVESVPLSEAERAELDAKAMALGIMPATEGEEGAYSTLEAAQEAAAPVERVVSAPLASEDRVTAREYLARSNRLPDFSKVGGVDLIRDVIYVDGMEFAIPKEHGDEFRLYCVRRVQEIIMERMAAAVAAFSPKVEVTSERDEAVQQVSGDETD